MTVDKLEQKIKKLEIQAKIEYEKDIAQVGNAYQPVHFKEVKYKNNSSLFIDIRRYQRGYDDEGEEVYFPTKIGFRVQKNEFVRRVVNNLTLSPNEYLHPVIREKSLSLLSLNKKESAIIEAFKCIEVTIRESAAYGNEKHGVNLIRQAFHPDTGPLTDMKLLYAEREALSNYISGAFGLYRNPSVHRDVEMSWEVAFERLVVASDILKLVLARTNEEET